MINTEHTDHAGNAPGQTLETRAFAFNSQAVRVIEKPDGPWFVAQDAAVCLGIENYRNLVAKLEADEKGVQVLDTPGGPQEMAIISEPALYFVMIRCNGASKPGTPAHTFRRWVTHEVLPAIRRTGSYGMDADTDPIVSRARHLLSLGFTHDSVVSLMAPQPGRRKRGAAAEPDRPLVVGHHTCADTASARHDLFQRMFRAVIERLHPDRPTVLGLPDWVHLAGDHSAPWHGIATSRSLSTSLGSFLRDYDAHSLRHQGHTWTLNAIPGGKRSRYLITPRS